MSVLAAIVSFLVILGCVGMAVFATTRGWLRRRNRVSRRHPSGAPLRWLVSPSWWASLHRRLRDAVLVLRAAVPEVRGRKRTAALDASPLLRLAGEIEQHAAALDHDLILAVRYRGASRAALRQHLTGQVNDLEALALRVAAAGSAATPRRSGVEPTPAALARIGAELDALEAARDEVARLEADLGLTFEDPTHRPWGGPA